MPKKIISRVKETAEQKKFWDLAESTAKEVNSYPDWKRIRQDSYHKKYYPNKSLSENQKI